MFQFVAEVPFSFQDRIRQLLDILVEERCDFDANKESSAEKKKREAELVAQGRASRDRVAVGIVAGERVCIGGDRVQLQSDGTVGNSKEAHPDAILSPNTPSLPSSSLANDDVGEPRSKRRRNNRQSDAIDALLGSGGNIQVQRLDFEKERHRQELEMRRLELNMEQERRKQEAIEREREFAFKVQESEKQFKLRQDEMKATQQRHADEMNAKISEAKETQQRHSEEMSVKLSESNKAFELKMKKIELMLSRNK